uniref:Uncharacterized protein n=1 Tax=Heterosigma akashiwo TaxID=2829 RepID=A0A7S4D899_HETAK
MKLSLYCMLIFTVALAAVVDAFRPAVPRAATQRDFAGVRRAPRAVLLRAEGEGGGGGGKAPEAGAEPTTEVQAAEALSAEGEQAAFEARLASLGSGEGEQAAFEARLAGLGSEVKERADAGGWGKEEEEQDIWEFRRQLLGELTYPTFSSYAQMFGLSMLGVAFFYYYTIFVDSLIETGVNKFMEL